MGHAPMPIAQLMSQVFAATPSPPPARDGRGPRGRWRSLARCLTLTLTLVLSLGLLAGCPAKPPSGDTVAPTLASRDTALWRQLTQIERLARIKPAQHEQTLTRLLDQTAPGSYERLQVLWMRGYLAAQRRDRDVVAEQVQQLDDWPNPSHRAAAKLAQASMLGLLHRSQGEFRAARDVLRLLDDPSLRDAPPLDMFRARDVRALVLADSGEMEAAIDNALKALSLADGLGESWRRATILNDLANIYRRADQAERARQTHAEAMQEAQRDPDPMLMNQTLTMRGILYADDPDSSISLHAYSEAIRYVEEAGADSIRALNLANFADYHLRHRNFARALELAKEALPLARAGRNLSAEIVAQHNLGVAKMSLGRVAEGRADVRASIALAEQQGATVDAAEGWQELGIYLERAGDLSGAIEAHHEYRRLNDLVLREDTRKAVLDAQERYDAEQRAKEIELLNRDNHLKAEQIRARDLELELWAALAGCILLSGALLGLAYQRIRKTNEALAHSNATLKIQSERDPLTGLANRRHFQAAIKELAKEGRLSGTVFLIDIDHFKRINDVHGHAAGDSVLVEVAQRLRHALREDDLVVRWGGEEFLIVVKAREPAYARGLAQRLLDLIAQPPVAHGAQTISVTASIGFASFPVEPFGLALNWERAIDLVDTVMYMAKAHGRNKAYGIEQIAAADEEQLAAISTRMEMAWHEGLIKLVALQGPAAHGNEVRT
jgi:diguanylate cyclase (GGDEF)-like protein